MTDYTPRDNFAPEGDDVAFDDLDAKLENLYALFKADHPEYGGSLSDVTEEGFADKLCQWAKQKFPEQARADELGTALRQQLRRQFEPQQPNETKLQYRLRSGDQ